MIKYTHNRHMQVVEIDTENTEFNNYIQFRPVFETKQQAEEYIRRQNIPDIIGITGDGKPVYR